MQIGARPDFISLSSPDVVGPTLAMGKARGIPDVDCQRDRVGRHKHDEPGVERRLPSWKRIKAQSYPSQHGNPRQMRHSEEPNEALALVDQCLRKDGGPHGGQGNLRLYMLNEQQARCIHGYQPCTPDSLHRVEP